MNFPELSLTSRRSCSTSPNRQTPPMDCQRKLDLNNDDGDGYKVDADINPATCTCAHSKTFYTCRISLLEQQNLALEKELQSISKNAEEDETLDLKTRSYENIIQIQKKLILEIQKRNEKQKIALKDAEGALEQHILMLEICRTEKNEAESMLSGYLIKNDSVQRQCEIAQLQKNLQKQKQKADEQIHNLKKILQEKENDLQQGTKCFNEINEKMKEMEIQGKYMSSSHAEEKKKQIDIENKLQHQVSNLKIQNSIADKKVTKAEKELEEMSAKYKEQKSIFDSKRCQLESEIKELKLQLDDMRKSTEYRCCKSDSIEKENISLRSELTEALKNIEEIRQECGDLSEKVMLSYEETLILQKDNAEMKDNLQILSKQLTVSENRVMLSNVETSKLLKDHTELKDNFQNLSKQLKESENRFMLTWLSKKETSILQTYNAELKDNLQNLSKQLNESENRVMLSKEETSKLKKDNAELKDNRQHLSRQLKESENRVMFSKEETSKLQEENAELKDNLKNLSKQLKEYENRVMLSKEETSKLQKDNEELKDNLQNLSKQLKESENSVMFSKEETSKFQEENAELKDNLKNLSRQIKESENRVMVSKAETSKLLKDNAELKDNLQNVSKQLKDSESRLSEEGNDQTLEQIGKGSIIRAQTMINYDLLLAEKSKEVTKKVSELYEDKWEVAMIELGENGGKEKNIEFLLKILENAYSFCECLEGRLTDGFEQAMVNAAANIKEVVDTTVFVRPILERLERCIIQLFFRQYSQYQEYRTKEPVYSYITEALSLSWFLVTRNPRVSISTTIPDESHLQFYDTYGTDGSEVGYVVLPMITWSTNKREIIRKGIAAFK